MKDRDKWASRDPNEVREFYEARIEELEEELAIAREKAAGRGRVADANLVAENTRLRTQNADYAAGNQHYHTENARLRNELALATSMDASDYADRIGELEALVESYAASGPTNDELRQMALDEHNRNVRLRELLKKVRHQGVWTKNGGAEGTGAEIDAALSQAECEHLSSAELFPAAAHTHLPCCLKCGAHLPAIYRWKPKPSRFSRRRDS